MVENDPGKELDEKPGGILNNRLLLIVGGSVLLLAVVFGVFYIISMPDQPFPEPIPPLDGNDTAIRDEPANDVAEVLPQDRREDEDFDEDEMLPLEPRGSDPFADPMRLTGIVSGGWGGAMAIIESSGTSYIVSVGDYIDDLWVVRKISNDDVILRAYNQEVSLYLDQPPTIRTLDEEGEDSSDEEDA